MPDDMIADEVAVCGIGVLEMLALDRGRRHPAHRSGTPGLPWRRGEER
jgi:hypothetical protein